MTTATAGHEGTAGIISEGSFDKLRTIMHTTHVEKGAALFWEGDSADKLYYVIEGRVRISKTLEDGRTLILYLHKNGDLFGQFDPFQDSRHTFSAEATTDSRIGIVLRKDLEVLLWQHGDLAIEFMKWMGLMHRLTQTKIRDLLMLGKPGALCSLLIRLGNTYGTTTSGEGTLVQHKMSHSEMADMIGTARESVNRMMGELRREDVIDYRDGCIVIKKMDHLRRVCQCENCPIQICRM